MRRAPKVALDPGQRLQLSGFVHSVGPRRRVPIRAAVVLRAADGATNRQIAEELGVTSETASRWRRRFLAHGVRGILDDAPRSGRPHRIAPTTVRALIQATVRPDPSSGRRWTARSLASSMGVSKSTVQRVWQAHGLRSRVRPEPRSSADGLAFLERVTDLVGLYLHTPARALAFATDERMLPNPFRIRSGRPTPASPRWSLAIELRAFLEMTERETPEALDVHLLMDSRVAPLPPDVDRWLGRHPRFHVHFLPGDAAGLSLIDRLVDGFSRRKDRPGTSASANRLRDALREHLRHDQGSGRPFVWTASSGDVRGGHGRWSIQR